MFTIGGRKRGMRRGIPNALMELDNRARKIYPQLLPSTTTAIQQYSLNGGTISDPCCFGIDPLQSSNAKTIISNGCGSSFRSALMFLIDVTFRLAHS